LKQFNALEDILFIKQPFGNVLVQHARDQRLVRNTLLLSALLQQGKVIGASRKSL
jgi:hypothetical protein